MLLLTSTSDKLRLTTGSAGSIDVHASWVDNAATTITPGRTNTAITTATTTDIVASPAASTQRNVKELHIRNKHASTSNTITLIHTDGTTAIELWKGTLPPGYMLQYTDEEGFALVDGFGHIIVLNGPTGADNVGIYYQQAGVDVARTGLWGTTEFSIQKYFNSTWNTLLETFTTGADPNKVMRAAMSAVVGLTIGAAISPSQTLDLIAIGAKIAVYDTTGVAAGNGGEVLFQARNSLGNRISYGSVKADAVITTAGAEEGDLVFKVMQAGTLTEAWQIVGASARLQPVTSAALGPGITDINLSFGASLNWDSSNYKMTHSLDSMTFSGSYSRFDTFTAIATNPSSILTGASFSAFGGITTTNDAGIVGVFGDFGGATVVMGTNTATALEIKTNDTMRIHVGATNGFVGVGAASTRNFMVTTSSSNTSWATEAAQFQILVKNSNSTNNNWMSIGFLPASGLANVWTIAVQTTNHATPTGNMIFYNGAAVEVLRLAGTGAITIPSTGTFTSNGLGLFTTATAKATALKARNTNTAIDASGTPVLAFGANANAGNYNLPLDGTDAGFGSTLKASVAGAGTFAGGTSTYLNTGIYGWVPTGGHGSSASAAIFDRADQNIRTIFSGGYDISQIVYPMLVRNTNTPANVYAISITGQVFSGGTAGTRMLNINGTDVAIGFLDASGIERWVIGKEGSASERLIIRRQGNALAATMDTTNANWAFLSTTAASAPNTASVTLAGGLGVVGQIYTTATTNAINIGIGQGTNSALNVRYSSGGGGGIEISTSSTSVAGGPLNIWSNAGALWQWTWHTSQAAINVSGVWRWTTALFIVDTTSSVSPSTGALIIGNGSAGGLGVGGAIYCAGGVSVGSASLTAGMLLRLETNTNGNIVSYFSNPNTGSSASLQFSMATDTRSLLLQLHSNAGGGSGIIYGNMSTLQIYNTNTSGTGTLTLGTNNVSNRIIIVSNGEVQVTSTTNATSLTAAAFIVGNGTAGGIACGGDIRVGGAIYTNVATFMHRSTATLNNGAGAGAGTITNAPSAGNPTKWIPIDDNGTTRHIPAW